MASIIDSLKGLITPDLVSQAASALGEDKSNVTKAVTAAVPTILGSLLAKGNDSGVASALTQAGSNSGILSNIAGIFSGKSDDQTQGIGSTILNSILGDKLGGVASLISSVSGISGKSSGSLLSMLGPVIGSFLGGKMSSEGLGLSGLLGKLNQEKGSFLSDIPSGLTSVLGISSLANLGSSLGSKAKGAVNAAESAVEEAKGGFGWLKWLIPLLVLLAALFFGWKSCKNKATDAVVDTTNTVVGTAGAVADTLKKEIKSLTDLTLPDGSKIKGFSGGLEAQVLSFLASDDYKKASAEDLKDKWFNFDNIDFEFGSATQLTKGSEQQIDNLVAVLKNYKDAKIKLGAYTDKKGNPESNLKLSQDRANTIKKIFTDKGLGAQIVGAEGYGDKFATVDVNASDDARAIDRKIAIRFEK